MGKNCFVCKYCYFYTQESAIKTILRWRYRNLTKGVTLSLEVKFLSIVWHSTKVIHNSSQSGQEKSDSRWHHKLVLYRPVCHNIVKGLSGRETGLPIRNCVPIYRELFKELYVSLSVLFWNNSWSCWNRRGQVPESMSHTGVKACVYMGFYRLIWLNEIFVLRMS